MNKRGRSGNKIEPMGTGNKINKQKGLVFFTLIFSISVMFLYTFTTKDMGYFDATPNSIMYSSIYVHAQMNSPNGSSITMLGNIVIPSNSNDTMTTTAMNNTDENVSSTAINKTIVAQNVTSAVNFLKEDPTFPISPTGISTQGLQQPPDHRIVNNSNIPVFK
jgi:hypothetical protein